MIRIILIDDADDTPILVRKALGERYELAWAKSIAEGIRLIEKHSYDLILLDVLLPDGDGFQLCARLQHDDRHRATPLIFLSGKTGPTNRVTGLTVGADDYVEKPFDPLELRARVETRLSKAKSRDDTNSVIVRGQLTINLANQTVRMAREGDAVDIPLTPLEYKILQYLARNGDRTYSRDQLISGIWGETTVVTDRTVDKHISSLRQKLGPGGHYIETVPGFGYRFATAQTVLKAS